MVAASIATTTEQKSIICAALSIQMIAAPTKCLRQHSPDHLK